MITLKGMCFFLLATWYIPVQYKAALNAVALPFDTWSLETLIGEFCYFNLILLLLFLMGNFNAWILPVPLSRCGEPVASDFASHRATDG